MDDLGLQRETSERALQLAISSEAYAEAARLQREVAELSARDGVAGVLGRVEAALREEDYAQATRLRDQGFTRLQVGRQGRAGQEGGPGPAARRALWGARLCGEMAACCSGALLTAAVPCAAPASTRC
jgi:hypothetical protein